MKSEIERRKSTVAVGQTDISRWSDPAQLVPAWQARSRIAAQFVAAGSRLLDVGCGAMTLETCLPPGCDYRPCDVVARDARTVVCDLNLGPLPEAALADRDLVTLLGVLEYLVRPDALLAQLAASGQRVLLSPGFCQSGAGEPRA